MTVSGFLKAGVALLSVMLILVYTGCPVDTAPHSPDGNTPDSGSEGLAFSLISDGTYSVSKGTAADSEIFIPAHHLNKATGKYLPVTVIGSNAFKDYSGLTGIILPASITSIGYCAFYDCTGLSEINLPSSVTSIGSMAFQGCTSLAGIIVPEGLMSIGKWALNDTAWYNKQPDGLVYMDKFLYTYKGEMPSNTVLNGIRADTVTIATGAFYDCVNLNSITIPEGVTSIGGAAFANCAGLVEIAIPASLASIGDGAFYECVKLAGIVLPSGVTHIGDYTFSDCFKLDGLILPSGVTYIGKWAFSDCSSLAEITIPAGVMSVGYGAFSGWSALKTINVEGHASQVEADNAWGEGWRWSCNARIKYMP